MEVVADVAGAHQFVGFQPNPFEPRVQIEYLIVAAGPYKPGFDAAAVIAVFPSHFDDR